MESGKGPLRLTRGSLGLRAGALWTTAVLYLPKSVSCTPNAGNHSVKAPLNIGIANAGANRPPALDISGLPVFTVWCTKGPMAGQVLEVTDLGRGTITGQCADIGKLKGPILRGLAGRAPYFHNGSAARLLDVVNFYDQRFSIGFTDEQKSDLVAFLAPSNRSNLTLGARV
jgi:cytochrome c peroxidase